MKWVRRIVLVFAGASLAVWMSSLFVNVLVIKGGVTIKTTRGLVNVSIYWGANYFADSVSLSEPAWAYFQWPDVFVEEDRILWLSIPHWLTNLVAWSLFFILWRKRRKHPKGHCQQCGYDLTGNTTGVCPECNTAVELNSLTTNE